MESLRHRLRLIVIVCLAIFVVAGCGRGSEPEPEAEPITLNMVTFDQNSNGEEAALEQYNSANPHITIERRGYSQSPQQYLLSDAPPDLMAMGPSYILRSAIQQDFLTDITDLWAQSGLQDSYPSNFKSMTEYNGKQYFVPMGYSWTAIYFNQAVFNEFNLTPPQTWDELANLADTLLANGVTPFSIAGQSPVEFSLWFDYLNLRLNGAEFHRSLMWGQESYDDTRVHQVFELWISLVKQGYFVPNASSRGDLNSLGAVIRGDNGQLGRHKAAMVLTTASGVTELPDKFQAELDFFRFPILDPTLSQGEILPSTGYMIPSNAPNRLAAIDLVAYLSSAEAQTMLFGVGDTLATFVPASQEVDQGQFSVELQQGMAIVDGADSVTQQFFWNSPSVIQGAISSITRRFWSETSRDAADIDSLLLRLEEARQEAIADGSFSE